MKKMILSALMMLTAFVAYAQSEGVNFVEGKTLYEVLQMGKQQNKLVFVDCYTTWCGPCKMMANREFPKKEAGDYFNAKFVNAKFDMEAGEGPQIAEKYQVQAYPTFLILNAEGELVHRVVGADEITNFIKMVDEGLSGKTFADYQKEYAKGERSEAFLKEYLNVLDAQYMRNEAAKVARELLAGKEASTIVADSTLFRAFVTNYHPNSEDPLFLEVCKLRNSVQNNHGDNGVYTLINVWQQGMQACMTDGKIDTERLEQVKARMRANGFSDKVSECEKNVHHTFAYNALRKANETKDAATLLKALQDYEPYRISDLSSEEGIGRHMLEELSYVSTLKTLAQLAPKDKAVKKYVKKQAEDRMKKFEAAKGVTSQKYDYNGKQQTMVEIVIDAYQQTLDALDGKTEAPANSVPATRLITH